MSSCGGGGNHSAGKRDPSNAPSPKEFTYLWNELNNTKQADSLKAMYGDSVLFYGVRRSRMECVAIKKKFFSQHPDFSQHIERYMNDEKEGPHTVRCFFIKKASLNGKEQNYSSYLVLKSTQGGWQITTEGDLTTDMNIKVLSKTDKDSIPQDAVQGDFDGDGSPEWAWVVSPFIDSTGIGCDNDCDCFIKFSKPGMPYIKIASCIGGTPVNHGDLNGDGGDEIGLLPSWFTSCWRSYLVYTLRKGKWIYAVDPITTHCNQWEEGLAPIKKDLQRKGFATITYSAFDSDIHVYTKSVPLY
jgi:hypothetical protein